MCQVIVKLRNREPRAISLTNILNPSFYTPPKEFKISELITLKLEYGLSYPQNYKLRTNIYINGNLFKQCKYLLLDFPTKDKKIREVDNIDDAMELYSRKMEHDHTIIPPETEFWGHCSNIQAWYENDYDIRILHSNLSLPMLKELVKHDKTAVISLKEQIAERIEKGGYNAYKIYRNYISIFNQEELEILKEFVVFPELKTLGSEEITAEDIQSLFE